MVFALEKLHSPSLSTTPNFFCKILAISKKLAPFSGANLVHGILIDPGVGSFSTQSGVRAPSSTQTLE